MNNQPLVSVIVPIHNAEKYLKKTLNSIINQTLNETQIILVNDGSNDKSSEICDEYGNKDNRIKIIHIDGNGKGVCVARNTGIINAVGEYIAFVDHDDTISRNMLEEMYFAAKKCNADLIDCSYRRITREGKNEIRYQHMHPKNKLFDKTYILENVIPVLVGVKNIPNLFIFNVVWNKLYKTEIIKKFNIQFDESRMKYEDRLFTVEFLHKAENILFYDKCFYNWILNPDSLITRYDPKEFDAVMNNQIRYRELFGNHLDFDSQSAIAYRITAITATIFTILGHRRKQKNIKGLVIKILQNELVNDWYLSLSSTTIINKIISIFIKNKKYLLSYYCFELMFIPSRLKQFLKKF